MRAPAVIVPSLGAPSLAACLEALASQDLPPARTVVVLSGESSGMELPLQVEAVRSPRRLGFAAAVNAGLGALGDFAGEVALLNDDALPAPEWLGALAAALERDPEAGAVQGTVRDAGGARVDGRGIAFDRWGLPVQVDRGLPALPEPSGPRPVVAVSGTACLLRGEAVRAVTLPGRGILDPAFGSYHEDLDLGLRLLRVGWRSLWVPGAPVRHEGSATGRGLPWRHPWWILANRWRALSGNLGAWALVRGLPRLLRGEVRAVRTLARENPRARVTAAAAWAAVPWLVVRGLLRRTPGPRLRGVPWGTA